MKKLRCLVLNNKDSSYKSVIVSDILYCHRFKKCNKKYVWKS